MQKELKLSWIKRPKNDMENVTGQYLDFIVSGESLKKYLGLESDSNVTPFGWFSNKKEEIRALKEFRLQTRSMLVDNRIELYICAACGDIACGSITAKIIDRGDTIIWTDFATQSNQYEINNLLGVSGIEFERQNYFQAFSKIK
jgi:hypothetical protein